MSIKTWLLNGLTLWQTLKEEKLNWKLQHQAKELELKQARILAEEELVAELKKRSAKLQHELLLLDTKNANELELLKIKCQQDVKDYKQYLTALDKLKKSIQQNYKHLPEAVAFTIHHHAQQLLNQMWEAEDFAEKMRHEMQLIQFMTTVHEDAKAHLQSNNVEALPEKTLHLIQHQ
ncbi:hypothetical protein DOJK_00640 [Patescibacteria group bacterium]|nr:hypothetical protein DOJK_00640 [Patescibacteria group bacterium]